MLVLENLKMIIISVLFFIITTTNCLETINSNIVNKNVERIIDLTSQLIKITDSITLENTGKDGIGNIHFYFEPNLIGNLSYIVAKDALKDELKIIPNKEAGLNAYIIKLKQGLTKDRTATIVVEYVLTKALQPYPNSITQKEKQLVRYFGNHYFYSPYKTVRQTSIVTLGPKSIENYSKLKPVSQSDTTITYGPYNDVEPLSIDQMVVHFENNSPFLTVTNMERLIEISHWGNIAIQENIEIVHTGAILKGSFSRYDYQRDSATNLHSIKSYHTLLPAAAHSIYYRDSNGNISTSQVRVRKDWIDVELKPRFPLFGGWKSSYMLGYSVPSYQYLFKIRNGQYSLKMRLIDHVFDDMHVENLETIIVLPVSVLNVKITLPYEVTRHQDGVAYKFLDNLGRQVIRLSKQNLVEHHIQNIEITYEWSPLLLLHEPILIAIALYLIFLSVIIYVRLDFSIQKSDKKD